MPSMREEDDIGGEVTDRFEAELFVRSLDRPAGGFSLSGRMTAPQHEGVLALARTTLHGVHELSRLLPLVRVALSDAVAAEQAAVERRRMLAAALGATADCMRL